MPVARTLWSLVLAAVLVLGMMPAAATAQSEEPDVIKTDNVTQVAHFPYRGGGEVDTDGRRYLFAGQAALNERLRRESNVTADTAEGGLRIFDLRRMEQVGFLDCPGTDNYVRYLDPDVYNVPEDEGRREYVVIAFHGNACTRDALEGDPNTWPGFGAFNGIMTVDVHNKRRPRIVDTIGHRSAHTVMPHPTRPYLFILPGGLASGTTVSVPSSGSR